MVTLRLNRCSLIVGILSLTAGSMLSGPSPTLARDYGLGLDLDFGSQTMSDDQRLWLSDPPTPAEYHLLEPGAVETLGREFMHFPHEPAYPGIGGAAPTSARENAQLIWQSLATDGSFKTHMLWLTAVGGTWNPYSDGEQFPPMAYNAYGPSFGDAGNYNFALTGYIVYRAILDAPGLGDRLNQIGLRDDLIAFMLKAESAVYQIGRGTFGETTWYGEDVNDVPWLDLGLRHGQQAYGELLTPSGPHTFACPMGCP